MPDESKKADVERVKRRNPPLAKVMEALIEGKTARDSANDIAEDIKIALAARDPQSPLAKSLDGLGDPSTLNIEEHLK